MLKINPYCCQKLSRRTVLNSMQPNDSNNFDSICVETRSYGSPTIKKIIKNIELWRC